MTHILGVIEGGAWALTKPWAGATVRKIDKKVLALEAMPNTENAIIVLRDGTAVLELPRDIKIVDDKGHLITPTYRFWVTAETRDPFHVVLDAPNSLMR